MSGLDVGLLTGSQTYESFVGSYKTHDLYNFTISNTGSLTVSLGGLSDSAGLQLLNSSGTVLESKVFNGISAEAIIFNELAAGGYSLQVSHAGGDTNYNLSLTLNGAGNTQGAADPLTGMATEELRAPAADLESMAPASVENPAYNAGDGTAPEATQTQEMIAGGYPASGGVGNSEKLPENSAVATAKPVQPPAAVNLFTSGTFTVDETGEIGIDYLYNGGMYQGELAIFSLKGMEGLSPGSEAFIKEAASRALSNSLQGYVVISKSAEGAKFTGILGSDNYKNGAYSGVKTFAMTPGDEFGVMLVPNGKVREVFEKPAIGGSKRPLFSLATANPVQGFHVGQISDVTGEGNTFVMEDMRVDGWTDRDYNDIIFQVRGAIGKAALMDDVVAAGKDWRTSDLGQALIDYALAYVTPIEESVDELVVGEIQTTSAIESAGNGEIQTTSPVSQPAMGKYRQFRQLRQFRQARRLSHLWQGKFRQACRFPHRI